MPISFHKSLVSGFAAICLMALAVTIRAQQDVEPLRSDYFSVKQVAPGVWALIVKPTRAAMAVSNAAVIQLGDKVLVVDSHLSPSAARDAARLIAAFTGNKPVHYLVNTHWHPDHVQGNSTYSSAFPGALEIIAHANTRRDIIALEIPYLKEEKAQLPKQIRDLKSQLESGTSRSVKVLSDDDKKRLASSIQQNEALLADIQNLEITLPNITLERALTLHSGDREVRVLYFGRGHTEGDVVVFLPRERVLVTGDLLTGSIPFMRDAFPTEWAATLAKVGALDYEQNIPGHGDVQQGKERLHMLQALLEDLVPAVRRAVAEGKSLDEARTSIKAELAPKHEKNFSNWNGSAEAAIERTYNGIKLAGGKSDK